MEMAFIQRNMRTEPEAGRRSYEVTDSEIDINYDRNARREVSRFLGERMKAILLDGYQVPGITAQYALRNKLIYYQEGDYYETAGV